MKSTLIFSMLVLVVVSAMAQNPSAGVSAPSPAKNIGLFAYPKNQQNRDQQLKDENDCYGSVRQQTGIDPQAPAPARPSAQEQQAAQQQAAQQAGKEAPKGGICQRCGWRCRHRRHCRGCRNGCSHRCNSRCCSGQTPAEKSPEDSPATSVPGDRPGRTAGSGRGTSSAAGGLGYIQESFFGMYGCPWIFRQIMPGKLSDTMDRPESCRSPTSAPGNAHR
jgi:hypothetical protein